MPEALQRVRFKLWVMERFGYTLTQLNNESAELMGMLEMESLGMTRGGEDGEQD